MRDCLKTPDVGRLCPLWMAPFLRQAVLNFVRVKTWS